jgi:DNA-binding MarR family transcriptional regulator
MNEELDRIIHQPIRTRIMAYLLASSFCDYTKLKNMFNLSDGHMTTHMRELIEHGYVQFKKEFVNNKSRTTYYLTPTGRDAFLNYVMILKKVITF